MSADATDRRDHVLHALSDATRRLLLTRIAAGAGSVAEISESLAMSGPAISKHLRVLEECGLIERQRDGRFHRFVLQSEPIREAIASLQALIPSAADTTDQFTSEPGEIDVALL